MKNIDKHLLFRIVVMVLVVGLLLIRVPQALLYLAIMCGLALTLMGVISFVHGKTAKKCPKCGGAFSDDGYTTFFTGTRNLDDGPDFDSMGYRVNKCLDCGNEHWRFFVPPSYSGNKTDQSELISAEKDFWGKTIMGGDFDDFETRGITVKQYQEKVRELKELITKHNLEAGFLEQDHKQDKEFEEEMVRYNTKNPLLKGNFLTIAATLFVVVSIVLALAKPFVVPALFTPRIIQGEIIEVENTFENSKVIIRYEGDKEYKCIVPEKNPHRLIGRTVRVKVWLYGIHKEIEY